MENLTFLLFRCHKGLHCSPAISWIPVLKITLRCMLVVIFNNLLLKLNKKLAPVLCCITQWHSLFIKDSFCATQSLQICTSLPAVLIYSCACMRLHVFCPRLCCHIAVIRLTLHPCQQQAMATGLSSLWEKKKKKTCRRPTATEVGVHSGQQIGFFRVPFSKC